MFNSHQAVLGPSLGPRMGGPYGGMGFGPQRGMPPPWCAPPWAMGQDMGMDPFDDIGGSPWDPHEAMFMQSLPHRRPASWPSWRRRRHPPRVPLWYDEEYDDWDDGDSFPSDSDFSPFGRPFDLDDDDDLGGFYRPFARGSELLGRRSRRRWSRRHPRRFFDDPFDSMDDFGGRGWRGRTGARRHGALRPPYAAD